MQGTVSEFDAEGGYGIINADDGALVLFNSHNVRLGDPVELQVGVRVEFHARESELGPHAEVVFIGNRIQ